MSVAGSSHLAEVEALKALFRDRSGVVVLTGAGISTGTLNQALSANVTRL